MLRPRATRRPKTEARAAAGGGGAVKGVVLAVAGAAVGVAGHALLERVQRKPKKVLGVPIPGTGNGLKGLTKEVKKAGEQFGHLASEVQSTRKTAEDIGKKAEGIGKALS